MFLRCFETSSSSLGYPDYNRSCGIGGIVTIPGGSSDGMPWTSYHTSGAVLLGTQFSSIQKTARGCCGGCLYTHWCYTKQC